METFAAIEGEPVVKKARLETDSAETETEVATEVEPLSKKTKPEVDPADTDVQTEACVATEPKRPATELDVGITEYMKTTEGFKAIIKQRYSDFNVNEVDLSGNVVHLTDMTLPEDEDSANNETITPGETKELDPAIVGAEYKTQIEAMVINEDKTGKVNIPAPESKEDRTKVHLHVKKTYTELETKTDEVDGQKVIQVFWKKNKGGDSRENNWPASKKNCRFVKFVLYKENKDTLDAIGLISKLLRIKENVFQYAGTKDKRARTSQEITANRVHPKKLVFLNKLLRNMGVGNFRYVEEPLKLGQLSGNQFTIVLRNVESDRETVDAALSSLRDRGFVNYYGMQRFGTTAIPTHKVGSALLHGNWDKAIDLILAPRNDDPSKAKFQKIWEKTKDATATLREVPRYCGLETNLLRGLERNMKPFSALEKISRNTRLLYVHSYQAFVWNRMTSRRLSALGHSAVVGDLVIPRAGQPEKEEPTVVTSENVDQYSIHDVVLPLPGHSVSYPHNEVGKWYRETLKADGLDIDNMKRPQKDYSLPGAYRHLTVKPGQMTWKHALYDDYTISLTASDWDTVQQNTLPTVKDKGKLQAVILQLTLPSSCYATMALREALKTDTSAAHQTTLNVS